MGRIQRIEDVVNEQFLTNANNWISHEVFMKLFDNISIIYNNLSPKLFLELVQEVSSTQSGWAITAAKLLGSPSLVLRYGPKFNRDLNLDQEVIPVSVNSTKIKLPSVFLQIMRKPTPR